MESIVYTIPDPKITGQQAAQQFAESFWEKPRSIAMTAAGLPFLFHFEDGTVWYRVDMADGGWSIVRTDRLVESPAATPAEAKPGKPDPLASPCGKCGATIGERCKNYKKQNKPPCRGRGKVTPPVVPAEVPAALPAMTEETS